jgi:hypothetical protein
VNALTVGAELTVFSASNPMAPFSPKISKIDRLMPIVSETEQISNRRNSPSKTRAEISDSGQCGDVPTRMCCKPMR